MTVLEITIQRKLGNSWPVVLERSQPGELPLRAEGELVLGATWDQQLLALNNDPLAYGTVLGRALFREAIRDAFVTARNESGDGLRTLLVVEDEALKPLHWERLCAPIRSGGKWGLLGPDQRSLFSLYLPSLADRRFPAMGRRDLRALVLVANPPAGNRYGLEPFDETTTLAGLRAALGDLPHDVLAGAPGALGRPTLDELSARMTAGRYTLLHVVAHGWYDDAAGETTLYLLDAMGQVAPVAASRLVERLEGIAPALGLPRLVFLATCESAAPGAERAGALGGLAQRLVRELGLPAVVAMTQKVSVATASALAGEFYLRLRDHGEVDRALAQATARLAEAGDVTVPVLVSRLAGRTLFGDTLDRDLTESEVEFGLSRLEALLPARAPVLQEEFTAHAERLRGMLGASRAALSRAGQDEWKQAEDWINALSEEALDLSFPALALGKEPPFYDARCPFPGLLAFGARFAASAKPEEDDRQFFFGREQLVNQLVQKLQSRPFLAVLGGSGSGKSSLVLAGLVPALEKTMPGLRMSYMTPGNDPLARLAAALAGEGPASAPATGRAPAILVVDQFEELFTQSQDDGKRRDFVDRLLEIAGRRLVVLTMRADFWGDCAPYRALRDAMLAHQILIAPMTSAELRGAMEQQAAAVGLRFEADLSNTILDAVRGEPGAMPLLQHLLLELWKRRHGRWLRAAEYHALGGIKQAIAHTADALYEAASPTDQARIQEIFVRLTRLQDGAGPEGERRDTRRRVGLADLVPVGEHVAPTRELVHWLAGARLVVTHGLDAGMGGEVEVAHEALIRYWPRLRTWLDDDRINYRLREGIGEDAAEWERAGRPDDLLPRWNSKLAAATELSSLTPRFFNAVEQAYLEACILLRDRETAEREERAKKLEAALADAQRQARVARAGQLAAQAQTALSEGSPQRGVLLALEALRIKPDKAVAHLPAAEQALRDALGMIGGRVLHGYTGLVSALAFSPDGRWLAARGSDRTARLWDLHSAEPMAEPWVLRGHEGPLDAMMFSPDGRWLATGAGFEPIRLWSLRQADPSVAPVVLRGRKRPQAALAFSPDGHWLATDIMDSAEQLWDLRRADSTATPVALRGYEQALSSLAFSPDGRWLATANHAKTARLWNLQQADPSSAPVELRDREGEIARLVFSPAPPAGGLWLAAIVTVSGWNMQARLWDLGQATPPAEPVVLGNRDDAISGLAFSPDGRWLATRNRAAMRTQLWDVRQAASSTAPVLLRGHEERISEGVSTLAFSPDGRWLGVEVSDRTARLWDVRQAMDSSAALVALRGHEGTILNQAFSPDGRWFVTSSGDKTTRLWDLRQADPSAQPIVLRGHETGFAVLAFSPDARWLATGAWRENIRLWDLRSAANHAAAPTILADHDGSISALAFSSASSESRGAWLATASSDNTARLWNLRQTDPAAAPVILRGHDRPLTALAFSPAPDESGRGGRWLATGSQDKTVCLWNLQLEDPSAGPVALRGHEGPVYALAFSPAPAAGGASDRWLATASWDTTIRLWNLSQVDPSAAPIILRGQEEEIYSLAFSPDGRWLATRSVNSKAARLWDLRRLADFPILPIILLGHEDGFNALAFSPDGRWLATGSDDKTARLWNLRQADPSIEPTVLRGHQGAVRLVAFSPAPPMGEERGRWLATGSSDRTVLLWDLSKPDLAAAPVALRGHEGSVRVLAFGPVTLASPAEGSWLATGSAATVRLWNLRQPDASAEPLLLRGHTGDVSALAFSADGRWLASGGDDKTARLWDLDLEAVVETACRVAGRNFSAAEWEQYFRGEPYRKTCERQAPGL